MAVCFMETKCPRELLTVMIKDYHSLLNSSGSSNELMLRFVKQYLYRVERHCDKKCTSIYFRNPLADNLLVKEDVVRFEKEIVQFLVHITKSPRSYKPEMFAEANCLIGMAHEFGVFGLPKHIKKALSFYSVAISHANAIAAYRIAVCYEKVHYSPKNFKKILSMYQTAAKMASPEALHTYGCINLYGHFGAPVDANSGILYLKMCTKMASSDYPFPFYDLAMACESTEENPILMPDNEYIFRLYLAGAQLGDANCIFRIAECLSSGDLGQNVNHKKAVEYYQKAAEKCHLEALYIMAKGLFEGNIGGNVPIEKDINKAYTCALYAAARMHTGAMLLMSEILMTNGSESDVLQAYFWIQSAVLNGELNIDDKRTKLQTYLDKLYPEGDGLKIDR